MVQPRANTTLVIERDLVASWTMCNNSFAKKPTPRSGALFQLGDFGGDPQYVLDRVEIQLRNEQIVPYGRGEFTWINIVSGPNDPVLPDNVFWLYPNEKVLAGDPCKDLNAPAGCLRNRRLHCRQESVLGVITYWAGANGFQLLAKQIGSNDPDNELTFTLNDVVTVSAYKAEGKPLAMTLLREFNEDDVATIKVYARTVPPSDGHKQDPPWPIADDG